MKKLLITRVLPAPVVEAARARFDVTLRDTAAGLTEAEATAALLTYDAILPTLGDSFTVAAFAAAGAPRARILGNFGVGYNHIDAKAARAVGVAVSNTPGVLTDATADLGMALLLAAARRVGEGERILRGGGWHGWTPTQMLGTHVTGKTVGIVGMGRIGQAVARRCHFGFDMGVVYYNRSDKAVGFPARRIETLEGLMGAADFVVVCVPGGAETRHLIDAKALAAMKPTGIFVNIARGDVVDETALTEALAKRQFAGAGLDVYEREPLVPEALMALENVVLLPHLGSATMDTRIAMGMRALENIIAWDEGRAPPHLVN